MFLLRNFKKNNLVIFLMVSLLSGFIFQPGLILAQAKTTTKSVADINMGNVVGSKSTSSKSTAQSGHSYFASGLTATGAYTGMENMCTLQLKWNKSQSILPQDEKYYQYQLLVSKQINGKYNNQIFNGFIKYDQNMQNINVACGSNVYIQLLTQSTNPLNFGKYGLVEMWYTLGSPQNQSATDWDFTMDVTPSQSGNTCTANIKWTRPSFITRTSNPLAGWGVVVTEQTNANKKVFETTTPLSPNTTSVNVSGGKLICGKIYTATVSVYASKTFDLNSRRYTKSESFLAGTAQQNASTNVPIGQSSGAVVQTTTNQTNINTNTGGDTECNRMCDEAHWWQSLDKQFKNTMCQMQCGIIEGYVSVIQKLFNDILLKSIL